MRSVNVSRFLQLSRQPLGGRNAQWAIGKSTRSFVMRTGPILLAVLLSSFWVSPLAMAEANAQAQNEYPTSTDDASVSNSDADLELTLEEILNQDPQKADYVDERRCISTQRIRNIKVLDDQHVVFNMRRGAHYLVQFKHRCYGLKPNQAIKYETSSSQLCKFDSIQGLENFAGRLQAGQRCAIPGFQGISEEQVEVLKETLKNDRQRAREERKARREAEHEARKAKRKV